MPVSSSLKRVFSVLASELLADFVADAGSDLVLELARTLDCNSSSCAPDALAFATCGDEEMNAARFVNFGTEMNFSKGSA